MLVELKVNESENKFYKPRASCNQTSFHHLKVTKLPNQNSANCLAINKAASCLFRSLALELRISILFSANIGNPK